MTMYGSNEGNVGPNTDVKFSNQQNPSANVAITSEEVVISKIQLPFHTFELVTDACYLSAHMYWIKTSWCILFLLRVFMFLSYLWILVRHVPHCCSNKHFGFGFERSFTTTSCKIIWISGDSYDMFKIIVIPCVCVIWLYMNNVPELLCFVEFVVVGYWSIYQYIRLTSLALGQSYDGIPKNLIITTAKQSQQWSRIDGLVQDYSNCSALAMELLQFCSKPSAYIVHGPYFTCFYNISCAMNTVGRDMNSLFAFKDKDPLMNCCFWWCISPLFCFLRQSQLR